MSAFMTKLTHVTLKVGQNQWYIQSNRSTPQQIPTYRIQLKQLTSFLSY